MAMNIVELRHGWKFKQGESEEWLPVARVPTNVHLDLMENDKIPDPFLGFNELQCQWVGDRSWTYRTILPSLPRSPENGQKMKHVLAFDGLDTYAAVRLDHSEILRSDNMFLMHRVDVTELLERSTKPVTLEVEFKPAMAESQRMKDAHPEHKWVGSNGDMARLASRKAQYHYGWDWGPVLMTCGPWRAVRLESYVARLSGLRVDYDLADGLERADGRIQVGLEGTIRTKGDRVVFLVTLEERTVFEQTALIDQIGNAEINFCVNRPKLWYPHGYGDQTMYTVSAILLSGDRTLHSTSTLIGFRKGELIQEADRIGKSFYFRFNEIDIFCGGSDWIPADSLTPRISPERYRKWLQMMVDGNQTMIRVWGGGIWEDDVFYALCDELGILVWQDFMFACGNYPCYPEFLDSVKAESMCQTERLRHHPCLAIYAGNNEDYQIREQFGLTYDFNDTNPESWLKTDFPARYIYEKLLPEVVEKQSPHIPYHPGSPWGDGKITSDPTVGDIHQWNVWHGTQEKYQVFEKLGGRFNSEFGMEAFPHLDTIKHFITDPSQLYPQSRMLDFHNKAAGHERRIATYLVENFRTETDLEKFIHLTQLSQAEALMFGYRGWRRQWGQDRKCGGALVWQLNDCWPVTSWAIVDYFLRKKPAYYIMRRALAPVAIGVKRTHHDWSVVHAHPARTSNYECWVSSSKLKKISADVELRYISIATGKEIKDRMVRQNVSIEPNGTTEILTGTIDNVKEEAHVLAARVWVDGEIISRDVDWPQPLKYLDLNNRNVQVEYSNDGNEIHVRAEAPTKGLVFEERDGVVISDNAIDVVPGDKQIIVVEGTGGKSNSLTWRYLGEP